MVVLQAKDFRYKITLRPSERRSAEDVDSILPLQLKHTLSDQPSPQDIVEESIDTREDS
ncbi:MAG TPA: hypothetical protein VG929_10745 [Actinomycetota bacterium]|nr:hypothetical protein [Actinomycetota bacterium]